MHLTEVTAVQAYVSNKEIFGDLYLPKDEISKKIGIVWLPGLPNQPKDVILGKTLSDRGYSILHLRYPGSWQSYGNFGPASSLSGALLGLDLLSKRKTVDLISQREVNWDIDHLILVGHSYGGGIAMCAQGITHLSDAAIVFSPLLEPHLQNQDPLKPEDDLKTLYPYLKRCHENVFRNLDFQEWDNYLNGNHVCNSYKYLENIKGYPILFVHGDDDKAILPFHTENFFNKLNFCGSKNAELFMVKGAGHDKSLPLDTIEIWTKWLASSLTKKE